MIHWSCVIFVLYTLKQYVTTFNFDFVYRPCSGARDKFDKEDVAVASTLVVIRNRFKNQWLCGVENIYTGCIIIIENILTANDG